MKSRTCGVGCNGDIASDCQALGIAVPQAVTAIIDHDSSRSTSGGNVVEVENLSTGVSACSNMSNLSPSPVTCRLQSSQSHQAYIFAKLSVP